MITRRYKLVDVDCANCAAKLEDRIKKIEGIQEAVYNYMAEKLIVKCEAEDAERIEKAIIVIIERTEPDAKLLTMDGQQLTQQNRGHHHHHHEGCDCGHEHHHHEHHHHDHCECGHDHHDEGCECSHLTHEGLIQFQYQLTGVDCPNCAAKLEEKIKKISGLSEVNYNFMAEKLIFQCDERNHKQLEEEIRALIRKQEPDAVLVRVQHHHEHCNCGHEHHHHDHCDCDHDHHEENNHGEISNGQYVYILEELDCANCAAKIENELKKMPELEHVSLNFMNKTLRFDTEDDLDYTAEKIQAVISRYEPQVKMVRKEKHESSTVETKKMDKALIQIIAGAIVFGIAMVMKDKGLTGFILFMISYLILGLEILIRAVRNILKGQVFDENFLMALATVGAIAIKEYPEGVAVMLFYQVGEYFQRKAVEKSRRSIASLMDIRPDTARVLRHGNVVVVDPKEVRINETMIVYAGDRIALDGIVLKGRSALDTSALTGESKPREVEEGSAVLSGSININGHLEVKVTSAYEDSTVAKILEMVENASARKAPAEAFITKFARVYTPIVVFLACIIGFILPLVIPGAEFYEYFYRALSFLVVSCPCALVISVPLSYFAGIGGLSKQGILVKGSSYLDTLNQVDTFVFDKTGTLTEGKFAVESVISDRPEDCLKLAAMIERQSNHPVSQAIVAAYQGETENTDFAELEEIAGRGMRAVIDGSVILVGNLKLMLENGINAVACELSGTHVYVAKDNAVIGTIVAKDQIKSDAKKTIEMLKALGKKCIMLTGDNEEIAKEVGTQLGLNQIYPGLLPQDKVSKMDEILNNKQGKVAFVGDGINDAPVLTASDVGFAMGALGSDAAIEAADIVLMNDNPSALLTAVKGARKTQQIVVQNIAFSLLIKIGVLLLIAIGMASMWSAVFADVGVAVIAICNAIRALKVE